MTNRPAGERFASVRARLEALGLWNGETLLSPAPGVVLDAGGSSAEPALFSEIAAPMAIFTAGRYSREFARQPHALRAATDDAAQMFGVRVPVSAKPRRCVFEFFVP